MEGGGGGGGCLHDVVAKRDGAIGSCPTGTGACTCSAVAGGGQLYMKGCLPLILATHTPILCSSRHLPSNYLCLFRNTALQKGCYKLM